MWLRIKTSVGSCEYSPFSLSPFHHDISVGITAGSGSASDVV
jgi:hypothetical protein